MTGSDRRFRFRLRTLFGLNVVFAIVMAVIRFVTTDVPGIAVLGSPFVWIAGAFGVVLMTAMGDAFGGAAGGIAGAVVGAALWVGTLGLCSLYDQQGLFTDQWPAHLTAVALTLVGVVVLGIKQVRAERKVDAEVGATAAHLLEGQRKRRSDSDL